MSRVQSAGAATPIDPSVHQPEESAPPAAQSRRFEPADPDRFDLEDGQPKGAPSGRSGTTNVETGHLTFHGGKVLGSPDVVPVYVGAYWQTLQGKRDRARNDAAMAALVKDPGQTGIWREYRGGPGTTSASKFLASAERDFSKDDVEALVKAQVRSGAFDASDPERIFMLVLPPGATLADGAASSTAGLGGFHGNITAKDGHPVYYAVVVYSQRTGSGVNGIDFTGTPIDNITITESHEITEAVTDPDVGLAIHTGNPQLLGWYDDTTPIRRRDGSAVLDEVGRPIRGKGEIGDIPVLNAELEGDSALGRLPRW